MRDDPKEAVAYRSTLGFELRDGRSTHQKNLNKLPADFVFTYETRLCTSSSKRCVQLNSAKCSHRSSLNLANSLLNKK
ncbi:hypothetical protein EMIT0373P_21026 [Pseudomonas chlororaphis]